MKRAIKKVNRIVIPKERTTNKSLELAEQIRVQCNDRCTACRNRACWASSDNWCAFRTEAIRTIDMLNREVSTD